MSMLSDRDLYLLNEGSHLRLYDHLGCHPGEKDGTAGAWFSVWAPDAESVSVIGTFNDWTSGSHRLMPREQSGIWEGFIPGIQQGDTYKFHIESRFHGYRVDKADPFAFHAETAPHTGSKVWDLSYSWNDSQWMSD